MTGSGCHKPWKRAIAFLAVAVALPASLHYFAYYGFVSNYTGNVFHASGFAAQYDNGVYRYRILGPWLLAKTAHELEKHAAPLAGPKLLQKVDRKGRAAYYDAGFLLNALFACGAAAALYYTATDRRSRAGWAGGLLFVALFDLLIAFSQFVVTPYDNLSYLLLALGFLLILRDRQDWISAGLLLAITVLATLTRETAVLLPAFLAAFHLGASGWRPHRRLAMLGLTAAGFAATYFGTRLALDGHFSGEVYPFSLQRLVFNLNMGAAFSLTLFLGLTWICAEAGPHWRRGLVFLLFCAPCIATIVFGAIVFEIRVWIPLLLGFALLAIWDERAVDQAEA